MGKRYVGWIPTYLQEFEKEAGYMAKGAICHECERETFVVHRCMKCKQEFCRECFDTKGEGWLCLKCSQDEREAEGVSSNPRK